jgi:N utilization substance protein B
LLLYEAEIRSADSATMVAESVLEPDDYTADVLAGVEAHRDELDRLLGARSGDWPVHRLAALDRAVLRLGAWELIHRDDVPTAVVLNEAVELAKRYGSDDSGGFVNGVLANLAAEVRPGAAGRDG